MGKRLSRGPKIISVKKSLDGFGELSPKDSRQTNVSSNDTSSGKNKGGSQKPKK